MNRMAKTLHFDAGLLVLTSISTEQTMAFGRWLASHLIADDIVCLDGDLGAGKTVLTRGLAEGLGSQGPVSSPTFTLMIEHPAKPGGLALFHFDAYRLSDSGSFCEIGLDEYFTQKGVSVIEWGEVIADILPPQTLYILLLQQDLNQSDSRRIEITWPGCPDRLATLIRRLKEDDPC
jgi:tRNA threonylcarbamoyladenosine biosynthesis protein TsaE